MTGFHAHLDACAQCRDHHFALCSVGTVALQNEFASNPLSFSESDLMQATFSNHAPEPGPTFEGLRAVIDKMADFAPIAVRFRVRSIDELSFLPKSAPGAARSSFSPSPSTAIPVDAWPDLPYGVLEVEYSDGTTKTVRFAGEAKP